MPDTPSNLEPTTVAVIGCGPGGMFLLHALAAKRKELSQKGDSEALSKLPLITCFERSSLPGGVWRSERDPKAVSTNMYDGLWINAPKEGFEFFDYTFDEHFNNRPQPAFLPRKDCFEYIVSRVTKHEDIFQDVQFNTTITNVTYDDELKKFAVTKDHDGTSTTTHFDKCIWASGINGKPKMIQSIMEHLEGFTGEIVHSSEMNRLESRIANKRVLMIGGNYSSEDLALQCTKLGAGEICITTRCNEGAVSYMGCWPNDNVNVMEYRVPCGVKDGNTILCRTTYYDDEESDNENDDDSFNEPEVVEVKDIDVVVFCTGYVPNADFLDPSLNPFLGEKDVPTWKLPKDWRMKPNMLTEALGHVKPSKKLRGWCNETYRGEDKLYGPLLITNPNMMFLFAAWFDAPLFETDMSAHDCLEWIMWDGEMPSEEEIRAEYREGLLEAMDCFESRMLIDKKYEEAVYEEEHFYSEFLKDKVLSEKVEKFMYEIERQNLECLLDDEITYPVKFGSEKYGFNEMGERYIEYAVDGNLARLSLKRFRGKEEAKWITFRDNIHLAPSMFTGTKPIELKGRWMDLDNEGNVNSVIASKKENDEEQE